MAKQARAHVALASLSETQLRAELVRRQSKVASLERRHRALSRRLAALEAKIRAAGGEVGGTVPGRRSGTRRRATNKVSLADALRAILKGKPLGVAEAADAVLKSGFKTTSKNFRTMVAIQLGKAKGVRRVERGVYTAT